MAGSIRVAPWTILATIFMGISLVFVIFASAYPKWQESLKVRNTGFVSIGLWEICFPEEGNAAPSQANDEQPGNRYAGCNYIFDRDMRFIRDWIYPDWFIVVVLFVTLGLLLLPVSIILDILYYLRVCSPHFEYILPLISGIMATVNGFLTAIAIIIFGIMSAKDKKWMTQPESNYLSWSYGICAFVPVFCFLGGTFHGVDFIRLKCYRDRNARAKIYSRGEFAKY